MYAVIIYYDCSVSVAVSLSKEDLENDIDKTCFDAAVEASFITDNPSVMRIADWVHEAPKTCASCALHNEDASVCLLTGDDYTFGCEEACDGHCTKDYNNGWRFIAA